MDVDRLFAEFFRRMPRDQRRRLKPEEVYVLGLKKGLALTKPASSSSREAHRRLRQLRSQRSRLREMIS